MVDGIVNDCQSQRHCRLQPMRPKLAPAIYITLSEQAVKRVCVCVCVSEQALKI